jgi:hypothetical protein
VKEKIVKLSGIIAMVVIGFMFTGIFTLFMLGLVGYSIANYTEMAEKALELAATATLVVVRNILQ